MTNMYKNQSIYAILHLYRESDFLLDPRCCLAVLAVGRLRVPMEERGMVAWGCWRAWSPPGDREEELGVASSSSVVIQTKREHQIMNSVLKHLET